MRSVLGLLLILAIPCVGFSFPWVVAPAANGGVSIGGTVTGGTANRVLYTNGSGNLADSAVFTFDGSNLNLTSDLITTGGVRTSSNSFLNADVGVGTNSFATTGAFTRLVNIVGSGNSGILMNANSSQGRRWGWQSRTDGTFAGTDDTAGSNIVFLSTNGFQVNQGYLGVNANTPTEALEVRRTGATYALRVSTDNASAPVALGVSNAGIVSIGNNIASPLSLNSPSGSPALNFTYSAGNNDGVINFQQASGDTAGITASASASALQLRYGGSSIVAVNASGMAVTGTTSISNTATLSGKVNIAGTLTATSSGTFTAGLSSVGTGVTDALFVSTSTTLAPVALRVSNAGLVTTGAAGLSIGGGAAISIASFGSSSLNFGATAAGTCDSLTVTLTGVVNGDAVFCSIPSALFTSDTYQSFQYAATGSNVVTVKRCNLTNTVTALSDPAAATVTCYAIR